MRLMKKNSNNSLSDGQEFLKRFLGNKMYIKKYKRKEDNKGKRSLSFVTINNYIYICNY